MAVRVLIVDDPRFFCKSLSEMISADPQLEVIATATNGQQAIKQTRLFKPNVSAINIEMPLMDGINASLANEVLSSGNSALHLIELTADLH